jgi:hypothetical protein
MGPGKRSLGWAVAVALVAFAAAPADAFYTTERSGHVGRMLDKPWFQTCFGGAGGNAVDAHGIAVTRTRAYPHRVQRVTDVAALYVFNPATRSWTIWDDASDSVRVRPGHVGHFAPVPQWSDLPGDMFWTVAHLLKWRVGGEVVGSRVYWLNRRDVTPGNGHASIGGRKPGWCYIHASPVP